MHLDEKAGLGQSFQPWLPDASSQVKGVPLEDVKILAVFGNELWVVEVTQGPSARRLFSGRILHIPLRFPEIPLMQPNHGGLLSLSATAIR